MLRRLLSALLSSIIFCIVLAFLQYTPIAERQSNTYYFSLFSLVMIYLIYATPVFVLGGVPCSILIDTLIKRILRRSTLLFYLASFICYALAGILVALLFFNVILFQNPTYDSELWIWFGAVPALLFYVIHLLLQFLIRRPQSLNDPWEESGKKIG